MYQDPCLAAETTWRSRGNESQLAVSSRRRALDRLRAAVESNRSSPILITGEPGAGKTWLTHQLSCILPSAWLSVRVDVTRAMDALDFVQLAGHSLGVPLSASLGAARARLHAILQDDGVDGRRWLLLVDDAHRAAPLVWDEIKALVNQSGEPGGFAAIIILGDTQLVRALATPDLGGFARRLGAHLHLPPLDIDEARELLRFVGHDSELADGVLEVLHRDARGNPGGLLRLAEKRPGPRSPGPAIGSNRESLAADPFTPQRIARTSMSTSLEERDASTSHDPPMAPRSTGAYPSTARADMPALIPTKPPIRVEEGLVEVGWDGDLEDEPSETGAYAAIAHESALPDDTSFNEELIEDRYAALQAWGEWTKIQENATSGGAATEAAPPRIAPEPQPARSGALSTEDRPGQPETSPAGAKAGIRAEQEHDFAPYSQLFTRLRQSKQP